MSQTGWTPVQEQAPPTGWTPVSQVSQQPQSKMSSFDDWDKEISNGFAASLGLKAPASGDARDLGWGDVASQMWSGIKSAAQSSFARTQKAGSTLMGGLPGSSQATGIALMPFDLAAGGIEGMASNLEESGKRLIAAAKSRDPQQIAQAVGHSLGSTAQVAAAMESTKPSKTIPIPGAQSQAERMYQSALKPSTTLPTAKVASMVKTGLEEGIPVSEAGRAKLADLVDDLNSKVQDQISQGSAQGATVNKYAVASRLSGTAHKFSTQVNPEADLGAVAKSGNEFLQNQPTNIPAAQAQAIKAGTYKQLGGKAYGELDTASIEAQKALARGIKEELQTQFPEIKGLNAREGQLIGLDDALERAVKRINNHQLIGIGTPIVAGATGAVTGSAPLGAVTGILKAVIDDPVVKSKMAIALNRAGKGIPISNAITRVAAYSNALASAANAGENNGQKQ